MVRSFSIFAPGKSFAASAAHASRSAREAATPESFTTPFAATAEKTKGLASGGVISSLTSEAPAGRVFSACTAES